MASNLVWAVVALVLLSVIYRGARSGKVLLPMGMAMTLALVLGFILLPAISVSDDLMAARQSTLPLSGQTWKIASEDASTGFVAFFVVLGMLAPRDQWDMSPLAERLARAQHLRPPPVALQ
jgi:hypothetical protein